jgi:hypothetical protein
MAAITALAHLGFAHPNDGGLRPEYLFQLSEGSRPAWLLEPAGVLRQGDGPITLQEPLVWIPTLEHMVDDLFVMIGVHILRDEPILELIRDHGIDPFVSRQELYSLPAELRVALYARCRAYEGNWKLALTVYDGSCLEKTLSGLSAYRCQLEVCCSSYLRYYDRWDEGKTKTQGELEK